LSRRILLLTAALALSGCPASKPAAAPALARCLPVTVQDENGAPVAGVTLQAEALAWAGPDGAFYIEGGNMMSVKGAPALSGADGKACLENASEKLAALRQQAADAANRGAGSFVYYGGFGPTRISKPRSLTVHATAPSMASTKLEITPYLTPDVVPHATLVMGAPRTLTVLVRSECDPKTIRVRAESLHQDTVQGTPDATVQGSGNHAFGFRLSGLGPYRYTLHTRSCDGDRGEAPFKPEAPNLHREINLLPAPIAGPSAEP
jgi:hypothetical protein